ncbi:hypothetical protein ATCVCanal1_191L [Acanthocystis turfacea Chlorella virus Canal-1]|nr:hypothetical protein ATCVCanal1_191L [Acanthocystis turfacea Chlorella virus Canal-1]
MKNDTQAPDIELGIVETTEHPPATPPGKEQAPVKPLVKLPRKEKVRIDNSATCNDDIHNYNSLTARFYMQAGLTSVVSIFCITMMAVKGNEGIYLPVLTGILGYWLPSPDSRVKRPRGK